MNAAPAQPPEADLEGGSGVRGHGLDGGKAGAQTAPGPAQAPRVDEEYPVFGSHEGDMGVPKEDRLGPPVPGCPG